MSLACAIAQRALENGGLDRTIILLKSSLNEVPAYKKTLKVKGYYEAKKKQLFIGNIEVRYLVWKQTEMLTAEQEEMKESITIDDIKFISEKDEFVKRDTFLEEYHRLDLIR